MPLNTKQYRNNHARSPMRRLPKRQTWHSRAGVLQVALGRDLRVCTQINLLLHLGFERRAVEVIAIQMCAANQRGSRCWRKTSARYGETGPTPPYVSRPTQKAKLFRVQILSPDCVRVITERPGDLFDAWYIVDSAASVGWFAIKTIGRHPRGAFSHRPAQWRCRVARRRRTAPTLTPDTPLAFQAEPGPLRPGRARGGAGVSVLGARRRPLGL